MAVERVLAGAGEVVELEVVDPQIAVDRPLCEQVVDDDQDGMGDGDSRLRPAAAGCQASVLRRMEGRTRSA